MFITTRLRKVHFRSSFGHPPARISSELFIRRSPPRLFTAAARTGLRPAPESRSRRAIPIIHAALRNGVSSWRTPFVTLQHTLVDKNEPGRIKKTLLSYPTSACSRNVLSLPFSSLQAFFKGDVVTVEKTPERAAAGSNSPLAQLCKRLHQGQIGMLSNHSQNLGRELFEWRNASAARLRSGAIIVPPALHPLDRRCYAHLEAFGRLAPRRARSHGLDNAFPQVTRIGLRHRQPPPARRINAQSLHHR